MPEKVTLRFMSGSHLQTFLDVGHPVRRVLIYRLGSLGDTVVALPCLHFIARSFPDAHRVMLTNVPIHAKAPTLASVVGDSGIIDDYIDYPIGTRNLKALFRLWWQIRRLAPDILIYLAAPRGDEALKRDVRFFKFCGIRKIVGVPFGDLGKPLFNEANGLFEHESVRLSRTLVGLGDVNPFNLKNWDLGLTSSEVAVAQKVLEPLEGRRFLVAGVGTKMQAKDWGTEKWQALAAKLTKEFPEHALVLIGAKGDSSVSEQMAAQWNGSVLNLCGQLSPRETAAVMQRGELFMGPDSGPMHLAVSVGVPCAIVFSARGKPGIWYPFGKGHQVVYHKTDCYGCNLETCIEQRRKCLESITLDEMFEAAMRAWQFGQSRKALHVL